MQGGGDNIFAFVFAVCRLNRRSDGDGTSVSKRRSPDNKAIFARFALVVLKRDIAALDLNRKDRFRFRVGELTLRVM